MDANLLKWTENGQMDDAELEMGGFDHNCVQSHAVYGDFGVLIMLEGSMTFTICNSCPQTQVGWGVVIFSSESNVWGATCPPPLSPL